MNTKEILAIASTLITTAAAIIKIIAENKED